jgi:uncharacterized protein (TIGR03435 family)
MRAAVSILIAGGIALAQTRPAYEVASIKLNNSASSHIGTDGYQGQIFFTNMPLRRLIARAYNVNPFQVSGPGWLEAEHFDIIAKYPDGATPKDRGLMLRTLLEDRFRLAVHLESKETSGFALVVAKSGFKLKPAQGEDNDTEHSGGVVESLSAKNTSIATLAELLSRYIGQPVIDASGIPGGYDFELKWSREDQNTEPARDAPPSIYTALQETLGLRLEPRKVPVRLVVVDHVERTPTEN